MCSINAIATVTTRLTDVLFGGMLSHCTESYDIILVNRCRHHVQFTRTVDIAEQLLIQFVRADQAKANQTHLQQQIESIENVVFILNAVERAYLDLIADLKAFIFAHQFFEPFGQFNVLANVRLQSRYSVISQNEPVNHRNQALIARNVYAYGECLHLP